MQPARWVSALSIAAPVLLASCARPLYEVDPAALLAAQRAVQRSETADPVVVLRSVTSTETPVHAQLAALRIESAPPKAPTWTVSTRRRQACLDHNPACTIVGSILLGSGLLNLVAGCSALSVAAFKPDPRDDGFGAILFLASGPLLISGLIKTVIGAVLLREELRFRRPRTRWWP